MTDPLTPSHRRTVAASRVEMTQMVLPQFANSLGNVFGGQVVSWIDICAAVAAQRHCRAQVVTASIDAVHFVGPIKQGHIVVLRSQVNAVFRTSMECGVLVVSEDPLTGEVHPAVRAYATFVALDSYGRPRPVPAIESESDEDHRRGRDAADRRAARLALRNMQRERMQRIEENLQAGESEPDGKA